MGMKKQELRPILKDKRFWFASFLIAWAVALQGHMMWIQKQDSFKQKFGNPNPDSSAEEPAENQQQFR